MKGQAFEPETTKAMGAAFEKACRKLGLSLRSDPATEHVAQIIIALAADGEHHPERLYQRVLAHFGKPVDD